jgi:hypothetical protein
MEKFNFMKKIILCMLIVCAAGCGLQKNLRVPESRESSIIGISVNTAHMLIFSNNADVVYFVKLDEKNDDITGDTIYPSNYTNGDYAYLVNARPGKYAAVASSFTQADESYSTFFDAKTIQSTIIEVGPGSIVYAGTLIVDNRLVYLDQNVEKIGDKAQIHYYKKLKTTLYGTFNCGLLRSIDRSRDSEKNYLVKTKKNFKDTEWIPVIEQKIESLEK